MYDRFQEESLEHFGIKGMKWGVRRTPEQLGHKKKQRTPEQIAKAAKRKETAIKVAKAGGKIAARAATAAIVGTSTSIALNAVANSPAGRAAIKAGADAVSNLLPEFAKTSADKVASTLGKALNVQSKSSGWHEISAPVSTANWKPSTPSKRAQELTKGIQGLTGVRGDSFKPISAPVSTANWKSSTPSKRAQELTQEIQLAARLARTEEDRLKYFGLAKSTK